MSMIVVRTESTPEQPIPITAGNQPGLLGKAFRLLDELESAGRPLGVSEMARRTGIAKSSVHRVLNIIELTGKVERVPGGFSVHRPLPHVDADRVNLRDVVLPTLLDLYELTHETVHLGVLAGTEVLCAEKLAGHRSIRLPSRVGSTLPGHCTATGKVLLAYSTMPKQSEFRAFTPSTITDQAALQLELARVRRQGVGIDRAELRPGVVCVAAPVFGADRRPMCAISVSGPVDRLVTSHLVDIVRRAADIASASVRRVMPALRQQTGS